MLLGEALKKARESRGVTQKELAERLYVDPSLICRWEKSQKRIPQDKLEKMLKILEISLDELKEI